MILTLFMGLSVEFMMGYLLLVIVLAILLDLVVGDPRWLPHPVVAMGKLISFLELRWNKGKHRRRMGILLALVVAGSSLFLGFALLCLAYLSHNLVGLLVHAYLLSTTIAIKGLRDAALQVAVPLAQGNLQEARYQLSMIVGRDTEQLNETEVIRGTVETVAENTVDGIIAPLFWAVIGGAPLALAYRAINTLDSMVGYKNARYLDFGWASARLDDAVNWLAARMTACCMAVTAVLPVSYTHLTLPTKA